MICMKPGGGGDFITQGGYRRAGRVARQLVATLRVPSPARCEVVVENINVRTLAAPKAQKPI